jgi:hypothetical protein
MQTRGVFAGAAQGAAVLVRQNMLALQPTRKHCLQVAVVLLLPTNSCYRGSHTCHPWSVVLAPSTHQRHLHRATLITH